MYSRVIGRVETLTQSGAWSNFFDKIVDTLAVVGLISMGVQVGVLATLGLVASSFEGTEMQSYIGLALVNSPDWFKAIAITSWLVAPLGAMGVGGAILRLVADTAVFGRGRCDG